MKAALAGNPALTQQIELARSLSMVNRLAATTVARCGTLRPPSYRMTDSFGTNSHFCLSAVAYADLLVLAIL